MASRNGYPITWTVDDVQGCTSAAGGRMPGAANLPASIASAQGGSTFSYGPEHQRYYQAATFNGATTDTTYIGSLFEVVSTSTTTEYRHNIIADGEVIAVHTIDASGNATTDYLHYDHLGSVDTITNDSGNVIQTMSFDAYGIRRDPSNWDYDLSQNQISTLKDYTDRGFTDQEQLDNVALVDLNGRVYDPTSGRMISADPTVPNPFYSQAFNRYAYVYNNPLIWVDPSGYTNWPLLGLGMLHMYSGIDSILSGGSLGVSGILIIVAGAGSSEIGVGIPVVIFGGGVTLEGISNAATGVSDVTQSGEDIYSSIFGNGSVPPDAITQIYGPTTGSILTDTSLIHGLLTKLTKTLSEKLLKEALKEAAQQQSEASNNTNKTPSSQIPNDGVPPGGNNQPQPGGGYDPLSGVPIIGGSSTTTGPSNGSGNTINLEKICVMGKPGAKKASTCPTWRVFNFNDGYTLPFSGFGTTNALQKRHH